ncbi:MAG: ATP-binding cassette domain-containing protein [Pontibacterium sp.]
MTLSVHVDTYSRGGCALLQNIKLQLAVGQFSVILGPNGAGKSTLLQLLSGQETLQRGEVALSGVSVRTMHPLLRARQLAMLTQDHPLSFPFTVAEVVKMGAHPLGLSDQAADVRVSQLLEVMELSGLSERNYLTLSGGEKQRVQLARVLAQVGEESRVLLLDEPLAGMDLRHQHLCLAYLKTLASRQGLIVVAVLHDPVLAARYADQLVLLKAGNLQAQGPVQQLWHDALLSTLYDLPLQARWQDGEPGLRHSVNNFFGAEPL